MADRIQTADYTRCRKRATDVEFEVCLDLFSRMIATWSKDTVGHHQQLNGLRALQILTLNKWAAVQGLGAHRSLLPSVCCSAGVPPAAQPTRVAGSCVHCKLLLSRVHLLLVFTARSCTPPMQSTEPLVHHTTVLGSQPVLSSSGTLPRSLSTPCSRDLRSYIARTRNKAVRGRRPESWSRPP